VPRRTRGKKRDTLPYQLCLSAVIETIKHPLSMSAPGGGNNCFARIFKEPNFKKLAKNKLPEIMVDTVLSFERTNYGNMDRGTNFFLLAMAAISAGKFLV